MVLKIQFLVKRYGPPPECLPVIREDRGAHMVIYDGCKVDLFQGGTSKLPFNLGLPFAQASALSSAKDDGNIPLARGNLLYINTRFLRDIYRNNTLSLLCPTCKKTYELTKQEIDSALERFLEGDDEYNYDAETRKRDIEYWQSQPTQTP